MAKEQPLWHRLYADRVLTAVAKLVGYLGFPVRELAQRTGELRKEFKAHELAAAFQELLTFTGNRVMLNEHARDLCWQLLGPPPEKWESWYRNADGSPTPRPSGRESVPIIPEREIDPITDGLRLLTFTQLLEMLQKARRIAAGNGNTPHLKELSLEQIPCLESEMVRRGMDIPPAPQSKKMPKKGKKKAG